MHSIQNPLAFAGACIHAGDYSSAARACRSVLDWDPGVGDAWFVLGVATQLLGKLADSVAYYRNAVRFVPGNAEAWNNMGASLSSLRRPEEAEPCLRKALQLEPGYAQAHNNLGNVLGALGQFDEAVACYHLALKHKPDYAEVFDHLGLALQSQGKLVEAVHWFDKAIEHAPESGIIRMNRALACLQRGDFALGWEEYEWRFRCREHPILAEGKPFWDGSPLEGRTVLLWAEQGLGDSIQFIRYAPQVKERGGRVIVTCPESLTTLLATCAGVDAVSVQGESTPEYDCHAPLMSLPRIVKTRLGTIPAHVPYLAADAAAQARWRGELQSLDGLRVGIVWQGNPDHKKDRQRSFRLELFEPLARIDGVRLISLQKGAGVEQLGQARGFSVLDLGARLGDLADAAAAMSNLDLLITPDTSLAHLAGSLGIPVWVALPYAPDWRWLLEREDTPWYPSMRLFRQRTWDGWTDVFARIGSALRSLLAARRAL